MSQDKPTTNKPGIQGALQKAWRKLTRPENLAAILRKLADMLDNQQKATDEPGAKRNEKSDGTGDQ